MKELLKGTTAYKIFSADKKRGKLSHAYMLHFGDRFNLKNALKIFAAEFFAGEADPARIQNESYSDFTLYPRGDAKITVEGVSAIIEDCAMRPVEGGKKLYAVAGFDAASALVQNKLLKTLEEPPAGVHFILGVTSLAPVLDTVRSRVKTLSVPPFGEEEILRALERQGDNPLNAEAAKSCGGILGVAEAMVKGGWFAEVKLGAEEICSATELPQIAALAKKYGDSKYREQLLSEMQNLYFSALKQETESALSRHALIYALEQLPKAFADVKFNAFFQGLLYDFMLKVREENDRWQKLQA